MGVSEAAKASSTAIATAVTKPKPDSHNVTGRLVVSCSLTGTPACTE